MTEYPCHSPTRAAEQSLHQLSFCHDSSSDKAEVSLSIIRSWDFSHVGN
jgi:hypothetical protein